MIDFHLINVVFHVLSGSLALLAGVVPLVSRKGGRLHRRVGRVFVWIVAVTLGTAAVGDIFFGSPPALIAVSISAGYGYLSSLRALALRTRGPGWIDAGLALVGLAACAALWVYMGPGTTSWTPALGYSTIGYLAMLAIYDLSRHLWGTAWLAHARPLDHGLKMTGVYFALMSAGVGNLLPDWHPWTQVGPSILGVVVMIAIAIAYPLRTRSRPREAQLVASAG